MSYESNNEQEIRVNEIGNLPIAINASIVPEAMREGLAASSFLPTIGAFFTHTVNIKASRSAVCAIDFLEDSQTRYLAAGYADGTIRIYDLMNSVIEHGPLVTIDPAPMVVDGPIIGISDVSWSICPINGNKQLLVGTMGFNCRVYHFSSEMKCTLIRATTFGLEGVRNPYANKGHIGMITQVGWIISSSHMHRNRFFSASVDGTARIHLNDAKGTNLVIKHGDQGPFSQPIPVNAAKYLQFRGRDHIFTAGEDGSVQVWEIDRIYLKKPSMKFNVPSAVCGLDVLCIQSMDDAFVALRCRNDACYVYSTKEQKIHASHHGLPSYRRGRCDIRILSNEKSPSEISLVTCTNEKSKSQGETLSMGNLVFLELQRKQCMLTISSAGVRRIALSSINDGAVFCSSEAGEIISLYQTRFDRTSSPGGYLVTKWLGG